MVLLRGIALFCALAAAAATAVTAFACTSLATLELQPKDAAPGQVVTVTGHGVLSTDGDPVTVQVAMPGAGGAALWTGRSDAAGTIVAQFVVPKVAPGYHVIDVAPIGQPSNAARVVLHVLAAPGTNVPNGGTAGPQAEARSTGASWLALALGLSAAGIAVSVVSGALIVSARGRARRARTAGADGPKRPTG